MAFEASPGELLIPITTKPWEARRRMIGSYSLGVLPPPGPQIIIPCFLSLESFLGKERIAFSSGPVCS